VVSKIRSLLLLRNSLLRRIGNAPRRVGFCGLIRCTSYSLQPIFRNFPVFFPVISEIFAETGSHWTASSASQWRGPLRTYGLRFIPDTQLTLSARTGCRAVRVCMSRDRSAEIIVHEAYEPNPVADLFDADALTGEDRAEIDLVPIEAGWRVPASDLRSASRSETAADWLGGRVGARAATGHPSAGEWIVAALAEA
jgi:hypothetical protein